MRFLFSHQLNLPCFHIDMRRNRSKTYLCVEYSLILLQKSV